MKKSIISIFVCFLFTFIVGCNILENNQYKITFNSNGGTEVSSITQDYNTKVTIPDDPTKTGYTFDGWYMDSDLITVYEFTTIPKENITLYAKWIESLSYTLLEDNTYSVSGYSGSDTNVLIPSVYNGCLVTTIGNYAFYKATSLTSITIPNSVTTIGFSAFYKATSLTSITIPNSVTTIGFSAFEGATSLTTVIFEEGSQLTTIESNTFKGATSLTSITIPKSVTRIGASAFYEATSLTSINIANGNPQYISKNGVLLDKDQTLIICYPASKNEAIYTIPNSVTTIGKFAFSGATSLTNITIPNSVTTIGEFAFSGATSLTNITIPKSLTTIGNSAFRGAISLTSINVDVDNPEYSSKDGVLFDKNQTLIISYPANKDGDIYTIPNSVTTIGEFAFSKSINLKSVIFEEGSRLTRIREYAFSGETSITSITIPYSVTTIGDSAFYGATSLTSITIPNSVTSIGNNAFYEATSITSITIPNSVRKIGRGVFVGTTSLISINVDVDNPQFSSIDGILFNKNQTLLISYPAGKNESTYTIPNSVTTIGAGAFYETTSLTSIIIPDSVTYIGAYAFSEATSLTSIIIPDSITEICSSAFRGATNLTSINVDINNPIYSSRDGVLLNKNQTTIIIFPARKTTYTIPNSVTTIGDSAFREATSLTNIIIPDSVTTIGDFAFSRATNLTSIIIPDSVTEIGLAVFSRATSLTSIIITATTPPPLTDFGITNDNLKIYVPSDYVSIYKEAWPVYASIIYPKQ